ncbi:response regulator transcription factor [Leucobacter iarius]|uniref:Response regulator transcription factor n=1 Tax=Leucobacter iarius TaxID=333963 RepID=A0ABP4XEE7_9MICO
MIRILVVDDHPIVRSGIVGLLEAEPDFDVVGEAVDGETALELAAALEPDLVLMDLRMPGMGGVEATRRILADALAAGAKRRVLVFTTYESDDRILAAISAGASGYLVKAAPAEELLAGVRAAHAGQTVLAPALAVQLAQALRGQLDPAGSRGVGQAPGVDAAGGGDPAPRLTAREAEILALVAAGFSNPGIAERLTIGESTVKTHLLHVFEKLDVSDRTRAVTRAMELGLI